MDLFRIKTVLGEMHALLQEGVLLNLSFTDRKNKANVLVTCLKYVSEALPEEVKYPQKNGSSASERASIKIEEQLKEFFEGKRKEFDISYRIYGSDFQQKVFQCLAKIPYGQTSTYKEIAMQIDRPSAYRAVANAIGRNPLEIILPCHRVLGSSGALCGFASGLPRKIDLLNTEKRNTKIEIYTEEK